MLQEQSPRLSHVGLYVSDVPKMIDFYTRVLGFVVSDGAPDGRITFLSRNPSDHHQVVLVRGRNGDLETPMVQQVSFNVGTLANVQRVFRKVREAGCKVIDPRCTAMPGRSISATPKATASRCSATRRGMCRSPAASRSISTRARTRSTAPPRPTAAPSRDSSPWRNGAPRSARRSPPNSMRDKSNQ